MPALCAALKLKHHRFGPLRDHAEIFGFPFYFFFGLMPELVFPPLGLSGLFPKLMRAGSGLLFDRFFHFPASGKKHGPSAGGIGGIRDRAVQAAIIRPGRLMVGIGNGSSHT